MGFILVFWDIFLLRTRNAQEFFKNVWYLYYSTGCPGSIDDGVLRGSGLAAELPRPRVPPVPASLVRLGAASPAAASPDSEVWETSGGKKLHRAAAAWECHAPPMAILAISDIILFVTLLVNAGAVLSFKLPASMCAREPVRPAGPPSHHPAPARPLSWPHLCRRVCGPPPSSRTARPCGVLYPPYAYSNVRTCAGPRGPPRTAWSGGHSRS